MDGFSQTMYKGKTIICVDYSNTQKSKEKILQILRTAGAEYPKHPLKSILALTNVAGIYFDMDILKAFKEEGAKMTPYEKKVAIIGVTGLLKAGYDFVVGFTKGNYRLFNTELEAKEWLVQD